MPQDDMLRVPVLSNEPQITFPYLYNPQLKITGYDVMVAYVAIYYFVVKSRAAFTRRVTSSPL